VRAGPPLLDNLVAALLRQPLKPHIPQSIFLSIISTGNEYAVAARGQDFCQEGWWVWKWKNRIDRYVRSTSGRV
jgi:selenide,water dikinase